LIRGAYSPLDREPWF